MQSPRRYGVTAKPSDRVLALWNTKLVAAAHRGPGSLYTLGVFSYEEMSTVDARARNFANADVILDVVRRRVPRVMVLSDLDEHALARAGTLSSRHIDDSALRRAIASGYDAVYEGSVVRQVPNAPYRVTVYVRKSVS